MFLKKNGAIGLGTTGDAVRRSGIIEKPPGSQEEMQRSLKRNVLRSSNLTLGSQLPHHTSKDRLSAFDQADLHEVVYEEGESDTKRSKKQAAGISVMLPDVNASTSNPYLQRQVDRMPSPSKLR